MNLFRSKNGNSTNHKFTQRALLLIPLALACFALLPKTQALVPPPDGGYPGFTTAEGNSALQHLTTGVGNTATGWHSLFANSVGNLNTAIGAGTLLFNTGDNNTATGALALLSDTTGLENTANGAFALLSNTTGIANTAIGAYALQNNTAGNVNVAVGDYALFSNTGGFNTAIGGGALLNNTTGGSNVALGRLASGFNTNGSGNTAIGYTALQNNTTGDVNTALGYNAGHGITGGSNIIAIGSVSGVSVGGQLDNSCYIGNIKDAQIDGSTASAVMVDGDGKLGTTVFSSQRFKKEIRPMGQTSEAVLALKPVTFRYKYDKKDAPQFGLIAEEVAAVNPDLVVRDKNGQALAIRYDQVNAMLLNEFLKEHRTVQEQKATIGKLKQDFAKQQKQIEALTAGLQKVSAQLELNKAIPQMVLNEQ